MVKRGVNRRAVLAGAGAAATSLATGVRVAHAADPVKVGVLFPLTGNAAAAGQASKAALEVATTLLAQGLAPRLRVVGVAPGLTLTSHLLAQEKFEQLHKLSPLGGSSTPEDVAHAVRFALENRSVTGTTLLVDGGQHLMKFDRDFSLM